LQSQSRGAIAKMITDPKIPVIFFGRLEMRKGICTFVEAIKRLPLQTQAQIQVYFIGRVVEMHRTRFGDLTSDQYITTELQNTVPYQILSDLYSQEAIEFIASLNHAIVCLASHQENFPNTGLEMGQLPFSLVVSDTGGFRETLALVDRTSGVYWFKPADPQSMSEAVSKAIAQHPEVPIVSDRSSLESTNQKLLAQKMSFIDQAFQRPPLEPNYPKVTIGITCYNLGQYLIECLTSVETQSYRYLEVIVFDDASPDIQTQEDIEKAKSLFPTYKFIRAEQNLGLGGARNRLIEMAEGDYFLPLDADNRLLPFAVEKFVEAAIANQAAIVICPMLCFGIHNGIHNFKLSSVANLLHENVSGDACSLFSTSLLKKFKHPERRDCSTQDWCMIAAAIATDATVVHIPYPLYEYRQRKNSMIKNASFAKERYYVRQYLAQIPPQDWSPRQIYMLMTAVQQLQTQLSASQTAYANSHEAAVSYYNAHIASQAEAEAAKAELEEVRQRLRRVRTRKDAAEKALEETNQQLNAMTTSKFWKLRKGWFKIKRLLRLTRE
jgi:O-antigen biosynthesis protein